MFTRKNAVESFIACKKSPKEVIMKRRLSDTESTTSQVTTVSELENDQRNKNYNCVKKC